MARSTNIDEANYLFRYFKDKEKTLSEKEAWLSVLDQILLLPDVRMK
jgi:hypothetical protein